MKALQSKSRRVIAACVALGAALGVVLLWLWPEPSNCTRLSDGVQACMPMHVVPPPLWAYFAFGAAGALAGLLLSVVIVTARRHSTLMSPGDLRETGIHDPAHHR